MAWSRFFRRRWWDDERERELRDYLAREIEDNLARGMDRDDATRAAHRRLGNPTRIREEIYDMNTLRLETVWHDLRYGMRLLAKNPTFTIVAVLTLALGTGANAAIFQLVNAVRLRALPVERPQELVSIGIDRHGQGRAGRGMGGRSIHTAHLWHALRAEQQAFAAMLAWGTETWDLSTEGEARPAQGLYVSGSYFDALGVRPHAGRLFTEADDRKGCGSPGVVLSHGFWQSRYGASSAAVGQHITLNRHPFEIVGVAPPGFFGVEVGRTFDLAVPLCAEPILRGRNNGTERADFWWLDIMGRLKPGWTAKQAGAHVATLSPGIFTATVSPRYNPDTAKTYTSFTFTVTPAPTGVSNIRAAYATELWILLGATGLVLLITCANLANLMLARATARDREIAVRMAIGASRGRIVRQMLSESLLIAALGAACGLLLAQWFSGALVGFLSTEGNRIFMDLPTDWRVFGFVACVAVAACLIFGLSPALKATGVNPGRSMQLGGRSQSDGQEAFALRRGLVVLQVALSTVLVIGALLFGRSLHNLGRVDLGFRTDGIIAMGIDLRRSAIPPEALQQKVAEIMEEIRAVPGVTRAAEAMIPPMSNAEWNGLITVGGVKREGVMYFNQVGGEYFHTLQTPLLSGRSFDERDTVDTPLVAVVNETFARRTFPNQSPLGQTFQMEAPPGVKAPEYRIVGLVRDTKYLRLREEYIPIAYLAMSQESRLPPFLNLVVQTDLAPGSMSAALTRAALEVAPGAAVEYDLLADYIHDSLVTERLMASLSGFFGTLAILIATIGLYGVMSYMVMRRRVEIGIRMALGADPGSVVRMVLGESGALLGVGVVAGVALAAFATRWTASLLYGLQPWDPASFAMAGGALAAVSLLAAWIPARRASRLAPTIALRE